MTDTDDTVTERMDRLESKLDQLLAGSQQQPPAPAGDQLAGRPPDVETQVRMELERARQEDQAAAAAADEKSEFQQMKDNLARLSEVKPASPQPRRERVMWGKR